MATFGPIASANPNVLFDPAAAIGAAQQQQRNQLLMENAKQDQQAQTFERDANARIALAREMADLPDDVLAAEWGPRVQRLQAAGFGQGIDPTKPPPRERLRQIAASDLTTFQRLQLDEKRRSSEAMMALLGGGAPAASVPSVPGGAPAGNPLLGPLPGAAPVQSAGAIPPPGDPGRNAALEAQRDALLDGSPQQLAAASAARGATGAPQLPGGYASPAGVAGQFAGLPAPSGVINANVGGGAAARTGGTDMAGPGPAPAPAGPAVGANGLTAEQTRILAVQAQTNPGAVPAMMSQFRQQNAMAAERAGDNARQSARDTENDRRFGLQQEQARVTNERLAASQERQAAADQRAAERAGLLPGWVRGSDGKPMIEPGGPADPEVIAAAAKARREDKPGRPIPGNERNELLTQGQLRDEIGGLKSTFQNDYGGYGSAWTGDLANLFGRNTPGASPRADWWQRYDAQKNQVRNKLFGSALTPGESAAFEKSDINPGMSADTIKTNLARQAEIIDTALRRRARSMALDGYNARAIEEATGIAVDVEAPAPQRSGGGGESGGGTMLRFNPATGRIE